MLLSHKKISSVILATCILITIFCGSGEKSTDGSGEENTYVGMTGTTQIPNLTIQTDKDYEAAGISKNKKAGVVVNLPLAIWKEFEYRMISTGKGGLDQPVQGKQQFCLVHVKDSTRIAEGLKVEVIDEATCNWSRFVGSNGVPRILEIGLLKIKVKSTGEEGWVFKQAIEIND